MRGRLLARVESLEIILAHSPEMFRRRLLLNQVPILPRTFGSLNLKKLKEGIELFPIGPENVG